MLWHATGRGLKGPDTSRLKPGLVLSVPKFGTVLTLEPAPGPHLSPATMDVRSTVGLQQNLLPIY